MAWCSPWLVDIIYSRLVGWNILDPTHFKKDRMTYSSFLIDSNTSWKECGTQIYELEGKLAHTSVCVYVRVRVRVHSKLSYFIECLRANRDA